LPCIPQDDDDELDDIQLSGLSTPSPNEKSDDGNFLRPPVALKTTQIKQSSRTNLLGEQTTEPKTPMLPLTSVTPSYSSLNRIKMQSTGSKLQARMRNSDMSLPSLGLTPLEAIKQQAMKLNDVYI
jgi:hypothetical protein